MARILYTILFVCVVVQLMFAFCAARDLTFDLDNMMDKVKDSLGSAADSVKQTSKDMADKIEDSIKSI